MALKKLKQSSVSDQHQGTVSAIVALADGNIISGGHDGTLRIWSPDLKLVCQVDTGSGGVLSIAEGLGKVYTATSDQTINSWTLPDLQKQALKINCLAPQKLFFEKDAGALWIGDAEGRVTKVEGDEQVAKFELTEEIWDLYVTNDPQVVYTGRDRDVVIAEIVKGELRSNAVVKGTIQGRYPVLPFEDVICCLDRDGRVIQVHENSVLSRFKLLREMTAGSMILNALCRGKERTVYAGGYDGTVSLWDTSTGDNIGSVAVGSCVNALTIAPGGAYAALDDGNIVLVALQ